MDRKEERLTEEDFRVKFKQVRQVLGSEGKMLNDWIILQNDWITIFRRRGEGDNLDGN